MATFGLVHGAYHGSWCWNHLRTALENRGHRVLTVDLPTEIPHAGANEYTNDAIEAFADETTGLVVVGHSLAGLTIPLIVTRRPVSRLVYPARCFRARAERKKTSLSPSQTCLVRHQRSQRPSPTIAALPAGTPMRRPACSLPSPNLPHGLQPSCVASFGGSRRGDPTPISPAVLQLR